MARNFVVSGYWLIYKTEKIHKKRELAQILLYKRTCMCIEEKLLQWRTIFGKIWLHYSFIFQFMNNFTKIEQYLSKSLP